MGRKSSSNKPAKARYKTEGHLKINKINRMVKNNGLTVKEAEKLWEATRKRRA